MDSRRSFSVLELPPDATAEQARQAYRDLVSVWHPDRHAQNPRLKQKAEEKLKEINAAYEAVTAYLANRPPRPLASAGFSKQPDPAGPSGKTPPRSQDPAGPRTASPQAQWQRTEAKLAALKLARERAEAKKRQQKQAEARARERQAAARKRQERHRALGEKKTREAEKREEARRARKAEAERQRRWQETEQRLQAILNNGARASAQTAEQAQSPASGHPRIRRLLRYLVRLALYTLALGLCLSANLIQNFYRFDIFAIAGLCVCAVAVCRLISSWLMGDG